MYPQHWSGFGLVPIYVSKSGENKLLLKFSDSITIDNACPIYLQHYCIKLSACRILLCFVHDQLGGSCHPPQEKLELFL